MNYGKVYQFMSDIKVGCNFISFHLVELIEEIFFAFLLLAVELSGDCEPGLRVPYLAKKDAVPGPGFGAKDAAASNLVAEVVTLRWRRTQCTPSYSSRSRWTATSSAMSS